MATASYLEAVAGGMVAGAAFDDDEAAVQAITLLRESGVRSHIESRWPGVFTLLDRDALLAEGFFGRGDQALAKKRIGEVCAMLTSDRAARIMRVDGQEFRHRGSHGGMTPDEMYIPVLAWRA